METIKMVVAIATNDNCMHQLDVQPQGFVVKDSKNKAYKLKKTLYGIKQTPKICNKIIDNFLS